MDEEPQLMKEATYIKKEDSFYLNVDIDLNETIDLNKDINLNEVIDLNKDIYNEDNMYQVKKYHFLVFLYGWTNVLGF